MLELGVPGLSLLLAFLGGLAVAGVRARAGLRSGGAIGIHAGLLGVFAVFLLQAGVDWIWESTAVTVLALMAVAVAAGATSETREHGAVTSASAGVALLMVAVLAVVVQLPGLASERALAKSREAFRSGDYAGAVVQATNAVDAQPWGATGYGQRGLAYEKRGELELATNDFSAAGENERTNWRWPLLDARIRFSLGDARGALVSLERSKQLRPFFRGGLATEK